MSKRVSERESWWSFGRGKDKRATTWLVGGRGREEGVWLPFPPTLSTPSGRFFLKSLAMEQEERNVDRDQGYAVYLAALR